MGIVVVGTTFIDIKGYPHGEYIPAGRNAGRVIEVHGGVTRNIVEDIANVGLAPTYVSVVDESGLSDDLLERLAQHGCNIDYVGRTEGGLGMWLAIFDEAGDVVGSISQRPDTSEIERILADEGDEIVSQADSVCIEFDIDAPILERTLDLAQRHGKDVYSPVTNMTIACERRDLLGKVSCLVCNQQEAGVLFSTALDSASPEELRAILPEKLERIGLRSMIVTMGAQGCVYVQAGGQGGWCPAQEAGVVDTTGAGDAFFAGTAVGLTYGKSLAESCAIGTKLAASAIASEENVCGRFSPEELGL
ncbi:MAG: carbohydrate kinase family protein [Eggerthellaceae bacterium]|nr:carbohydrate kinase family protein [Eggerthellaceae bacterium]